jgi:hypothetical protein
MVGFGVVGTSAKTWELRQNSHDCPLSLESMAVKLDTKPLRCRARATRAMT